LFLTYLVYFNPGHLIAANYDTKAIDNYFKFIMVFSSANIVFYLINIVTKKEK
jgi:hypothetical protein